MGVLFDLGVSSPQLDRAERGFSYWSDAPLDMRMDARAGADRGRGREHLLRGRSRTRHRRVRRGALRPTRRGGDRAAPPARDRPATSSTRSRTRSRRRPAARAVTPPGAPSRPSGWRSTVSCRTSARASTQRSTCSRPGGRMLVLAYHSLEDRLVKQRFAGWAGTRSRCTRGRTPPATTAAPRAARAAPHPPTRPCVRVEVAANPRGPASGSERWSGSRERDHRARVPTSRRPSGVERPGPSGPERTT